MDQLQKPENEKKPRGFGWMWWVVLAALMMWNLTGLLPLGTPTVNLPYGALLDQVKAGNVASVTIAGADISGTFKQPVTWPPATPTPAASGTPAAAPTANPGAAAPGGLFAALTGSSSAPSSAYTQFDATFPEAVGDPTLLPLLRVNNVTIDVKTPATPWFMVLLTTGLPILLLVVLMVYMGRNALKGQNNVLGFGKTKALRTVGERPEVTFADVAGADEAKSELQEIVGFLRDPQKYYDIGAHIPRGVLLVGAPGTGKTLMAKAVAGEAGVPFFNISASEFVEMFVGVGASRVRDLFTQAKTAAPAIVFIDELDAVGRRRGAGLGQVNDEREQTLNQLLVEMDGFDDRHEVIILAATNRPDVLDPALLRPGRFDREVTVALPDCKGREGILRIHTQHLVLGPDVDLGLLAKTTTGLSGADLANLANEAALTAARHDNKLITLADFEEALDRILLGAVRPLLMDPHERGVVAYHELGHALVAWLQPGADPVHKVSIIPRGRTLGVTEQLPEDDRYNYTRSYLMARLAVLMGGRVAEDVVFGDITTGAENDLVEATRLARRMVTRWGMGSLGPVAFQADEAQPFLGYELSQGRDYGSETADHIDHDVQTLLTERYSFVRQLLTDHRDQLDQLVTTLLHEETIDQEDMADILGPRDSGGDAPDVPEMIVSPEDGTHAGMGR